MNIRAAVIAGMAVLTAYAIGTVLALTPAGKAAVAWYEQNQRAN